MLFDESVEIIPAVIVGDLVARLDGLDRADDDRVLFDIGLGVRPARVIDVARDVAAGGTVDGPAAIHLEQILGPELIGLLGGDQPTRIVRDEVAFLERLHREQAEPGLRAANAETATGRWATGR